MNTRLILAIFVFFIYAGITNAAESDIFSNQNNSIFNGIFDSAKDIQVKDLGIADPLLLPGDKLYPLKEWWRNFTLAVTYDKEKKLKRRIQISSQRLFELKKLADEKKLGENILTKSLEKHAKDEEGIYEMIRSIENEKTKEEFLKTLYNRGIAHQRIFDYLQYSGKLVIVQKYTEDSFQRFVKFIEEQNSGADSNLKEYVNKNIAYDKKSLHDVNILERIKAVVGDEKIRSAVTEAVNFAVYRIKEGLESLPKEQRLKTFMELLGVSATSTVELDASNILDKIRQEKEKLEKELQTD